MVDFGSNKSTETFLLLPKVPYVSKYIEKQYVLESSVPGNFGISQRLFNNDYHPTMTMTCVIRALL